jgi:hypothetical protein
VGKGGGYETGIQPASAAPGPERIFLPRPPFGGHLKRWTSMTSDKAVIFCVGALFLSGLAVSARADAGEAEPVIGPVRETVACHEGEAADATPLQGADSKPYQPLTGQERWDLYLRAAYWSPGAVFRAAGPALGAQLNNEPSAWGQGMEGYGKRFANRFGRFTLKETFEAAGAAALGHEVRYIRAKRSGFLPRAAHALTANFVTYDRDGRRTPHIARVGSAFAAEFTGNLWMPAGYRDPSRAVRGVGMELGVGSAFNLIREFAPELKRVFTRR